MANSKGNFPVKICTVEPKPDPPPFDVCKDQRRKQKIKAGIWVCPIPEIPEPTPAPECFALCKEKIKNFPGGPILPRDFPIVCKVPRKIPGTERCDRIEKESALAPDLPWPGCPPIPPPPPPPEIDLCERQKKDQRKKECKERMKRFLE